MSKKIVPMFVVIANSLDEKDVVYFSQCLGVFDNFYEAVGCAYSYISDLADSHDTEYENVTMLYEMENDGDFVVSYEYKERGGNVFKGFVGIHDNRGNLREMEDEQHES